MPLLFKRILFRLHWLLGIGAGLVLSTIGISGCLLAFQDELVAVMNPSLHLAVPATPPLGMDALLAAARASDPDRSPNTVIWNGTDSALQVRLGNGQDRRGVLLAIDPYSGKVLGTPRGFGFFQTVEQLHRNLTIGPVGKQIVGASTAILLLLLISGIVLRWPRRAGSLRAWLRFDTRLKGRGFFWHLHATAGTWALLFYLVTTFTGLSMSYDVVRNAINAMAGVSMPARTGGAGANGGNGRDQPPAATVSVDRAWETFHATVPDARRAMLNLPRKAEAGFEWRYLAADAPHGRAFSTLKLDAQGKVVSNEPYADLPRGRRFVSALFPLHSGEFFGLAGRVLMALTALLLPLFFVTGLWLWMLRRALARRRQSSFDAPSNRG